MIDLAKQFDVYQGKQTVARYTGPRDPEAIHQLYIFLRRNEWKGMLYINFSGNGGVSDIVFSEKKLTTAEVVALTPK